MHEDIDPHNPPPTRVGCQGLVRLESGEVLAVRPTYGDHRYQLPGGHRQGGERRTAAASRELFEETGLTLPRGRLLVVDEIDERPGAHTAGLNFVYDYGTIPLSTVIRLPAPPGTGEPAELDAFLWLAPDLLDELAS
ncbi:NUDIX domain-containing protein [Streptomyces chrestomyceticus]|uniref:NUDIX domain-containing protein n=1 Tax=Streptomyces chrestomyceticus TaxID=68185 RepID=UPI0019D236C8|nr:NUDIX hydrolase [Streptomyces chrestomyceticus]